MMNRWALFFLVALASCDRAQNSMVLKPTPAPELTGALTWLNSPAVSLATLRGKVVLLHFFDYASADSVRDLPYLKEWQKRYGPSQFVLLGIHTPERDFALDPINVSAGIHRLGITYPVAVDSGYKIAGAYQNKTTPCFILVDQAGGLRFERVGPGQHAETETHIQTLLREINPIQSLPVPLPNPRPVAGPVTPMLCVGNVCGRLGNEPASITNGVATYALPADRELDRVYVAGQWSRQESYLRHAVDVAELTDALVVRYRGADVSVVMKPEDVYWKQVLVQQDGQWLPRKVAGKDVSYDEAGRSYVRVNMAALYEIVAGPTAGTHELQLFAQGKGLSVYSFHFSTTTTHD
jgi:hypothetical protein